MAHPIINREFYESIVQFDVSDDAKEYYYQAMDSNVEAVTARALATWA